MKQLIQLQRKALLLYYKILKNHLRKLPPQMRHFGDFYVRQQFRQHNSNNSTLKQYQQFYNSWFDYNRNLQSTKDAGISLGKTLSQQEISMLSQQQKDSLNQLKNKTKQL